MAAPPVSLALLFGPLHVCLGVYVSGPPVGGPAGFPFLSVVLGFI